MYHLVSKQNALVLATLISTLTIVSRTWADEPSPKGRKLIEQTGRVTDYRHIREWQTYYWREDWTLQLTTDSGEIWRVISREPTPAYDYRMGPTYAELDVDWQSSPRVKVIGVAGIDRLPAEFYDLKLDEPLLITALLVFIEVEPDQWKEYYVNNWFHRWGDEADQAICQYYADKPTPYDVYGFVRDQVAPFDERSQAILARASDNPSLMFHGRLRVANGTAFGYVIELIDLIGRDPATGGPLLLHGDAQAIPRLDMRKPE